MSLNNDYYYNINSTNSTSPHCATHIGSLPDHSPLPRQVLKLFSFISRYPSLQLTQQHDPGVCPDIITLPLATGRGFGQNFSVRNSSVVRYQYVYNTILQMIDRYTYKRQICIYACIHIYVPVQCIYIYTCTFLHAHMYYLQISLCIPTCTCPVIHTYMCIFTHLHTHMYIPTQLFTYLHVHTYLPTYIHMYIPYIYIYTECLSIYTYISRQVGRQVGRQFGRNVDRKVGRQDPS